MGNISVCGFIIHTKENDRSQDLKRQLNALHFPYKMVTSLSVAFNKSELAAKHRGSDLYQLTVGRDLNLGDIGTSVGHQLAYAEFLKCDFDWALILEDDAFLSYKNLNLKNYFISMSPTLINIGDHLRDIPTLTQPFPYVRRILTQSLLAHSYLINRPAAFILVEKYKKYGITSLADCLYPQNPQISCYTSITSYFTHNLKKHESLSDISKHLRLKSTEQALTMPITFFNLLRRIRNLRRFQFTLKDIIYHEISLRFRVRTHTILRRLFTSYLNINY